MLNLCQNLIPCFHTLTLEHCRQVDPFYPFTHPLYFSSSLLAFWGIIKIIIIIHIIIIASTLSKYTKFYRRLHNNYALLVYKHLLTTNNLLVSYIVVCQNSCESKLCPLNSRSICPAAYVCSAYNRNINKRLGQAHEHPCTRLRPVCISVGYNLWSIVVQISVYRCQVMIQWMWHKLMVLQ